MSFDAWLSVASWTAQKNLILLRKQTKRRKPSHLQQKSTHTHKYNTFCNAYMVYTQIECICICVSARNRFQELFQEGKTSGGRCSSLRVPPAIQAANQSRTRLSAPLPTLAPPQTGVHDHDPDGSHCARSSNCPQVCFCEREVLYKHVSYDIVKQSADFVLNSTSAV